MLGQLGGKQEGKLLEGRGLYAWLVSVLSSELTVQCALSMIIEDNDKSRVAPLLSSAAAKR